MRRQGGECPTNYLVPIKGAEMKQHWSDEKTIIVGIAIGICMLIVTTFAIPVIVHALDAWDKYLKHVFHN